MADYIDEINAKQTELKELQSRIKDIKAELKSLTPRSVKQYVKVAPLEVAYRSMFKEFSTEVEINGKKYNVKDDLLNNDTYAELLMLSRRLLNTDPSEQRPKVKDLNKAQIKFLGDAINRLATTYNTLWKEAREKGLA